MTAQPTAHSIELLDAVAALARQRMSSDDLGLVLTFVSGYFAGVSPDDLAECRAADLCGAALVHPRRR